MLKKLIFILSLCLTGCGSIPGFYSGYKRLSTKEKQRVVYLGDRDIDTLRNDGNIYLVKAEDILNYVKKKDRVWLYDWGAHCSAKSCVPLDVVERLCKEKGFELLVVMEYHCFELIPAPENFSKPILFIDTKHYRTDYCNWYTKRFYKELTGKTFKELNYERHYCFVNGKFEGVHNNYLFDYLQEKNLQ